MVKINPSLEVAPDFSNTDAVIMDIDGVLIDVTIYEFVQSMHMLARYGKLPTEHLLNADGTPGLPSGTPIAEQVHNAFRGSNGDPIKYYQLLLDRADLGPQFHAWHIDGVERFKHAVIPHNHAVTFLGQLAASDKRSAYWTSRDRELVTPQLVPWLLPEPDNPAFRNVQYRQHGFVDRIITADDVGVDGTGRRRMKPDSAGMEILSKDFDIPPEHMVMLGDRLSDIIPAKKLGALAIAVKAGYVEDEEYWHVGADAIISDMSEAEALIFPRT